MSRAAARHVLTFTTLPSLDSSYRKTFEAAARSFQLTG
jgi:hypothetical protein